MKTLNFKYTDDDLLVEFIKTNNLSEQDTILLQIFSGTIDKLLLQNLIEKITKLIPNINIIGTTTSGEIFQDEVLNQSIICSFTIFDNSKIKVYHSAKSTGKERVEDLVSQFDHSITPKVAISFADGLHSNGEEYLDELYKYYPELIVSGGLAGDNSDFKETFVFTQDTILDNGVVIALIYNNDLAVYKDAKFGWQPIGKKMTITKSVSNIVYEIDGITPLEIYKKYLGDEIACKLPAVGIEFPLIVQRGDIFTPRSIIGVNSDGSFIFAGNLNQGDIVSFGYGTVDIVLSNNENILENITTKPIESIFIYSCAGRKQLLGKIVSQEISYFNNIAPTSGFFTYGEFYTDKSEHFDLLNETMTILCLSEKQSYDKAKIIKNKKQLEKRSGNALKALSYFIDSTTKELEDEKNFIDAVLNSQDNIVITTNGEKIVYANKAFLDFFEVGTIAEFRSKVGSCICNAFVENIPSCISSDISDKNWLDYMSTSPNGVHKVAMKKDGKNHIFSVSIEDLKYGGDNLKSVVLTDVTEILHTKEKVNYLLKNTKDSIQYATAIQSSLLPSDRSFSKVFQEFYMLNYTNNDILTQIYTLDQIGKNKFIVTLLKSKKDGVKGIFETIYFYAIKKQLIYEIVHNKMDDINVEWIRDRFLDKVDPIGGFLYYNLDNKTIQYCGLDSLLYYIYDDKTISVVTDGLVTLDITDSLELFFTTATNIHIDTKTAALPFDKQFDLLAQNITKLEQNNIAAGFFIDTKSKAIVEYEGEFNQDIVTKHIDIIEDSVTNIGLFSNISTIYAEQFQNIIHYGKSAKAGDDTVVSTGYIALVKEPNGQYTIISRNNLTLEDKKHIEPTLIQLQKMDRTEIRKQYRELRRSGKNTHSKGGGIGFYEIAKRSSLIEYDFTNLQGDKFEFELRAILLPHQINK